MNIRGLCIILAFAVLVSLGTMLTKDFPVNEAQAQSSGQLQVVGPLTRDLGAIRTFTAQGAATVTSSDQNGFNVSRVTCVFNQASHTGSPSTTFSIQNKDAASGGYVTLITSAAITADTTPGAIHAGAGVATTANIGAGVPIAKTWRVSATVGGSATPVVTGTIGCSVQ